MCSPSRTPSNHPVVSWSLAPTTRKTRFPFQASGTVTSRRYQPMSASSFTPESALPHENGTTMKRSNFALSASNHFSPTPASALSNAKRQVPLRFSHSVRSQSGRGCSGRGIPAQTPRTTHTATSIVSLFMSFPFVLLEALGMPVGHTAHSLPHPRLRRQPLPTASRCGTSVARTSRTHSETSLLQALFSPHAEARRGRERRGSLG